MIFDWHRFITQLTWMQNFWSRAGGGGGGHSGGGSYGGGSYGGGGSGGGSGLNLIFILFQLGPTGWFILIVIAVIAYFVLLPRFREFMGDSADSNFSESTAAPLPAVSAAAFDGNLEAFIQKAGTAFLRVQLGWSQKTTANIRKFITDGIYQKFNAQFTMMNLLGQTNPISNVKITEVNVVKVYTEGNFKCVDVQISAIADDQFICEKFPQLNSPGGREPFTEFWTFIIRTNHKPNADLYLSEICPQCSAPLTDKLMDTAQCPYCKTYLNGGEFDWVLSEITQESEYGISFQERLRIPPNLGTPVSEVIKVDPSFSKQVLEDCASNALMQIMIASATHQPGAIQKISTTAAFQKLSAEMPRGHLVYDRLFTRSSDLLGLKLDGSRITAFIGLQYSSHEILLENPGNLRGQGEEELTSHAKILVMVREIADQKNSKGSIYAGTCANCGAPVHDSLLVSCTYCGAQLNNPKTDWIVTDLLDTHEGLARLLIS